MSETQCETSPGGHGALVNPEVIIEILYGSTEAGDQTLKLDCYKTHPGFRKPRLVHSGKKKMEIITRLYGAEGLSHTYENPEEEIEVESCRLQLEDIYKRVEF